MSAVRIVNLGISSSQGKRESQEDRFVVVKPAKLESRKDIAIFAVFDGHGGASAVKHVYTNLVDHIDQQLRYIGDSHSADGYKTAIQNALKAEDGDLTRENLEGGSTVALALIDMEQGLLVSADLGDSHIVLAQQRDKDPQIGDAPHDGVERIEAPGWGVERLSREFNPSDPDEKSRIERAGGKVTRAKGDCARVGGVNMSRALGDVELKLPRINEDAAQAHGDRRDSTPSYTDNLVSNEANFDTRHLHGRSLLLICSDGVGQGTSALKAACLAVKRIEQDGASAQTIADELTKRAGKRSYADNCTVVIACLDTAMK